MASFRCFLVLLLVPAIAGQNIALNKPAFQSSIGWGGSPSRGVDGNKNPQWGGATCTHTQSTDQAWWAVDLGSEVTVSKVVITNRQDCCSDRLANFQVGLTNTSPQSKAPVVGQYEACATQGPQLGAGETKTLSCGATGRYLVVQLKGRNYLTLCEVEVYGGAVAAEDQNIALNKPAFQSSFGWGGSPSRGVDGNNNPQWGGATCTHTQSTNQAWWAVDLGSQYTVSRVVITNRQDCCSDRLANFQVGLTNTSPQSKAPVVGQYEACATQGPQLGAGETKTLSCGATGQYLIVQLKGRNYLTLCEVEVYGGAASAAAVEEQNVALNKPAFQSSIGWGGSPSRGVDGNKNPQWGGATCTHTQSTDQAWWAVDLGSEYTISKVVITNRQDCCSDRLANFQVGLTNTSPQSKAPVVGQYEACATQGPQLGAGETKTFSCGATGRYLVVQLKGRNYLTLCEVEAWGKAPEPQVEPTQAPEPEVQPTEAPEPEVQPTEAPEPEVQPTEAPEPEVQPTEAPTCVKERALWAEGDIPVDEPAFTDDCQFELKQCNAEKCFCVTAKKGKRAYDPVEVPLNNPYDCSKKPKKCQKKVFKLLIKGKSGYIPQCAKSGHYETKQCFQGECWCVRPKGGKERKNTRTTGDLKC